CYFRCRGCGHHDSPSRKDSPFAQNTSLQQTAFRSFEEGRRPFPSDLIGSTKKEFGAIFRSKLAAPLRSVFSDPVATQKKFTNRKKEQKRKCNLRDFYLLSPCVPSLHLQRSRCLCRMQ